MTTTSSQPHTIPLPSVAKSRGGKLRADLMSGFMVFLIALPLCLGIAMASGFPPIAGIFAAIVGGLLCPLISDSEKTIKGPAAGLIVIALGAVTELGAGDAQHGYKLALGVGVVAGVIQVVFGLLRSGVLGEFFPLTAVHGMLAAIGVIVASKQVHTVVGVKPTSSSPLALIQAIPESLMHLNPNVAIIGAVSLLIMFGLPFIKHPFAKRIPAAMLVLLVAVPLGRYFDLGHEHTYLFLSQHEYSIGPKFLVELPNDMLSAITLPDFSGLQTWIGWKYVVMFSLVGALESVLSAKAVDLLDPDRRKTNLNRDLVAVGAANVVSSFVGGLPVISEIVRSSANINAGGKSRLSNVFHGAFLLGFVYLLPGLIHQIPLAALAAMLINTGFRLASPKEFFRTYKVGAEQLAIFLTTLIMTLATDLLVGIAAGILLELAIHCYHGAKVRSLFKHTCELIESDEQGFVLKVQNAALFSNWIALRHQLIQASLSRPRFMTVDMSDARIVDHSVMEKLHQLQRDFAEVSVTLEVIGLEQHRSLGAHPHAARVRVASMHQPATTTGL